MPATANRTDIDWEEIYARFPSEMYELDELVSSYEREKGISVSPGALQVLYMPIVEGLQRGEPIDIDQLAPTLAKIFSTLIRDPDPREEEGAERSSRSMLKAIAKNWCGIPPICSRRDRA